MSEMKSRIQKITGSNRFKSPVAFVVGKYDAWGGALLQEGEHFYQPVSEGCISQQALDHNSNLTRKILMEVCPQVAKLAESLSDEVRFFPVSSFGAPACQFTASDGKQMKIPDPEKLDPFLVDSPLLWLMNRFDPNLVPVR